MPSSSPAQQPEWHFERDGEGPSKLVWQAENGVTYDLWHSTDLMSWSHVDGFPKQSQGAAMEHSFDPSERGFFKISISSLPARFVWIPGGSFEMGDSFNEGGSYERPVHTVEVSGFYMQSTEVSKAQWDEVATWAAANGYDISASSASGKGADHPAHSVTWYECVKWCNARSQKEGLTPCYTVSRTTYKTGSSTPECYFGANGYRLPSEAEWEKAARGGLSGRRFPWGDTITHGQANYYSSSSYSYDVSATRGYPPSYNNGGFPYTSPAGSFAANGYGLYDMAGNLFEWCNDWFLSSYYSLSPVSEPPGPAAGSYRVLRGGHWYNNADNCRVARRRNNSPGESSQTIGFRPVRRPVRR